jgi:hypothetical protein
MKRDFRGAIEPHRNYRGAGTDRRIANHISVLPCSRAHVAWQDRIQSDWNPPRKTNLPAMGVPAEEQAEVSIRRLLVDLRSVHRANLMRGTLGPRCQDRFSGSYCSEDRHNQPFELPMANDYKGISPAGASGTATGLYKYKPRSSAVAPGFGPLFVTP